MKLLQGAIVVLRVVACAVALTLVLGCRTPPSPPPPPPPPPPGPDVPLIYIHSIKTPDYEDVETLSIIENKDSGEAKYVVNRYSEDVSTLLTFELGTYTISGGEINVVTNKQSLHGSFHGAEIVIGDRVFSLTKRGP